MTNTPKNIEVEMRSQFSQDDYTRIYRYLMQNAQHLGADDKELHFYIYSDKLLKVANNITKQTAKISLKLNRIGAGNDFEEFEIYIGKNELETALKMMQIMTQDQVTYQYAYNIRDNFSYDGVEIALKYSNTWGYHAEFEIMVGDTSHISQAENDILLIADKLGVSIMTQNELKMVTLAIDTGYTQGKYTKGDTDLPTRPII